MNKKNKQAIFQGQKNKIKKKSLTNVQATTQNKHIMSYVANNTLEKSCSFFIFIFQSFNLHLSFSHLSEDVVLSSVRTKKSICIAA